MFVLMLQLTKAEEEVMQVLWSLDQSFVKDMIPYFPDPKPAYNTVSTIIRILENKGFVAHDIFGRTHRYKPVISKETYSKQQTNTLVNNFFKGSYQDMLSYFIKDKKISLSELENILNDLKKP
jgi:BlaI family penicillinase repressor